MCKHFKILAVFLVAILMVVSFSGCAIWKGLFGEEEKGAAQIMSEGLEDFEDGEYESAIQAFQQIKDRYPYSKFALEAELKMADALFNKDRYDEAFDAYSEFEKLHPKNPNIPYVMYQKAMCHFSQVTTIDRDQSNTLRAKEEFSRLIKRFPRNEYGVRARMKLRECYIFLAEYELYVGQYYYKSERYRTAKDRFRYLIENYPDLGQYYEALEYLNKCNQKISEQDKKKTESFWRRLIPFF